MRPLGQLSSRVVKTLLLCLHSSPLAFTLFCPVCSDDPWVLRMGFCYRLLCPLWGWYLCIMESSEAWVVVNLHVNFHLLQREVSGEDWEIILAMDKKMSHEEYYMSVNVRHYIILYYKEINLDIFISSFVCGYTPHSTSGEQSKNCRSWLSFSVMWIEAGKFWSLDLEARIFPLTYLTMPN